MAKSVKRPYVAPKREVQARETRDRILAVARNRFLTEGYRGTRLADVARDAGVAEPTVYATFTSKQTLLVAVLRAATRGEETSANLLDRPDWQALLLDPEPASQLHRLAALATAVHTRNWDLIEVVRAAAGVEPDLSTLLRQGGEARLADCRIVVESVAAHGNLRPGLSVEEATDVVWALVGSELYRMLVGMRGWTAEHFEGWLASTLIAALLPARPTRDM
jgi:AcrR family transcriptional regulator